MNTILQCPTLASYLNYCRHPEGTHTPTECKKEGEREGEREREREREMERK